MPMVTIWPPASREFPEFGNGFLRGDAAEAGAGIRRGCCRGFGSLRPPRKVVFTGLGDCRDGATYEDDDIIFCLQVTGINVVCVDDCCGEMVLFHDPPDPAGGHGAAVGGIPEGDAGGVDPDGILWLVAAGIGKCPLELR